MNFVKTVYPSRWLDLGGTYLHNGCGMGDQVMDEWHLNAKINNQSASDAVFYNHWDSWFGQADVDRLVEELMITSVRIPLGFWIIEGIVDRETEFYAKGGLHMLTHVDQPARDAEGRNIAVLLDHHASPGVASSMSAFAGNCTTDVCF